MLNKSQMQSKPSKRFCKFGFLTSIEKYNQDLHNYGQTIEERSRNFYTPNEIKKMEDEVANATNVDCSICSETIDSIENTAICSEGHQYHNQCLKTYWEHVPTRCHFCPITNTVPHEWHKNTTIIDINK